MEDQYHVEGHEAYYEGLDRDDNPYAEGSDAHDRWEEGWEEADEEGV